MPMILSKILPFVCAFLGAFLLTLVLTPLVREFNRRHGMVDKPDPRRINKVPIPRGGGIAIVVGVFVSYAAFVLITGRHPFPDTFLSAADFWKMVVLSSAISVLGLIDDRFGMNPKVKLLGQLVIAALTWAWGGLGFHHLWPSIPVYLDCVLTVFWITGAVNAFNLIDGLDGLASGIALIATIGMAGSLLIIDAPAATTFYFAMAGGLLGFLRYNYHPASVFLGDSGSMFLGFVISTLPLASQTPNSFLVSVGVPLLAMGVPIFDTSLAILRRSIRHLILRHGDEEKGNDKVMTADSDHLHHRILRAAGQNQRKAAWTLYGIACCAVAFGLIGMLLRSRTAGLWLIALAVGSVIVFKNMARIELFDAGRLLGSIAHDRATSTRRLVARIAVPLYLVFDLSVLAAIFAFMMFISGMHVSRSEFVTALLIRVASTFFALVVLNTYRTVWSRAVLSNFIRLFLACVFGSVVGGAVIVLLPTIEEHGVVMFTVVYASFSFIALVFIRIIRPLVRDVFYILDCSRLRARKDVSRILVYGGGLRYRAFRRELVRTTSANDRMIVGIIDDDIVLRGHYIGGVRIYGSLNEAPEIINEVNADTVVIACDVSDEWLDVVRQTLAPTGVRITKFEIGEKEI